MKNGGLALCLLLSALGVRLRAAEAGPASATNLVPIPFKYTPPSFKSIMVEDLSADPHVEPSPTRRRAPFLAPPGVTNLALRRPVTSSSTAPAGTLAKINDGEKDFIEENVVTLPAGKQWVQVDLGRQCRVYAVLLWHDERLGRIFQGVVVQAAEDPGFTGRVITLFNNDHENRLGLGAGEDKQYRESFEGKLIDARGAAARYIRCYSNGARGSLLNQYTEIEVWGE